MSYELREKFIAEARSYLGVRFRHQGRSRETGVDCAGLVILAAQAVLGWGEGPRDYPNRPAESLVFELIRTCARRIPAAEVLPGDVAMMNYSGATTHFAILTESDSLIHATILVRKVVEIPLDDDLRGRVRAWWRLNGIGD